MPQATRIALAVAAGAASAAIGVRLLSPERPSAESNTKDNGTRLALKHYLLASGPEGLTEAAAESNLKALKSRLGE